MTDDKLLYEKTIVTSGRCALCQKPSHYYLTEFRDGYCCLECKRRLRTRWKKKGDTMAMAIKISGSIPS